MPIKMKTFRLKLSKKMTRSDLFASNESGDGPSTDGQPGTCDPQNPVLPLFVQMNIRHEEPYAHWKEACRWVKFQEDVEEGGKRWSKPFVPALQFTALTQLRHGLNDGILLLDVPGKNIDCIIDEMKRCIEMDDDSVSLTSEQCDLIKFMLKEEVKMRIKTRLLSKVSSKFHHTMQENVNDSPQPNSHKKHHLSENMDDIEEEIGGHHSLLDRQPSSISGGANVDEEDSAQMKILSSNPFAKKIPRGAEAALIQVAAVNFLQEPLVIFLRTEEAISLSHLCEISVSPTRFLGIILGPPSLQTVLDSMGKVLGALMSDQIFPLVAYRAATKEQIINAVESYTNEVIILAPSAWDPAIRLEPPATLPTLSQRIQNNLHNFNAADEEKGQPPEETTGLLAKFDVKDKIDLYEQLEQERLHDVKKSFQAGVGGHCDDEALQRTGRLFGGLVADIKRKLPWYWSDFKDGFHIQALASIIYIYLATITKAITFGGFLGDVTYGLQGVLESFLGHAIAGGIFCLFGGQPLTVLGCTGPVLVFEKILIDFCHEYDVDYMTLRLWIGLWSALFCLIIVAFDISSFVRYFTRFTEESFAALIGFIFIAESLKKLHKLSKQYKVHEGFELSHLAFEEESCHCLPPDDASGYLQNATISKPVEIMALQERINGTISEISDIPWDRLTLDECKMLGGQLMGVWCHYVPDIFFFSVTLFFGTFLLALSLKNFKYTSYFPSFVRSLVSDFAVIIAILVFVFVDEMFNLETPKLIVPTVFKPTRSDIRGWIVPFIVDGVEWYVYLLAFIPALLLTILLFMDQQITSVIVNRKEHKLKKGCGYHLDMFVLSIMMVLCSVLGLPWCVAATVLCLGHVDSLKMETEASAPGEKPTFLGVREQRVTGTAIFLLTGLSVKLAPILKYIPMPVLYGVLLYMGITSLKGMQFIERILLMMMPPKYQPDYIYLRHVPLYKVHLFTCVQVLGLALLWILKSTQASLVFPLMVLALVGLRKAMDYFPRLFSQQDLFWLDNLMPSDSGKKKKAKSEDEPDTNDENDVKAVSDPSKAILLNLNKHDENAIALNETLRRASVQVREIVLPKDLHS